MQLTPDLDARLPADTAVIADARAMLHGWLADAGVGDREVVDDLSVVLSELVANAVEASPHDGSVVVRTQLEEGTVVLSVVNDVREWVTPAERWDLDDPLRPGGRGLLIVSALADDVTVQHDIEDDCTVVTARLRVGP
ncbi:MAG TPA: ATP-binding protein [Acidimicrobiales bacterium]|nr:ATP-binding protein [Acidimicrobiales bacterium]